MVSVTSVLFVYLLIFNNIRINVFTYCTLHSIITICVIVYTIQVSEISYNKLPLRVLKSIL